jgi:DNA-binding MarR family transcriptional regulator
VNVQFCERFADVPFVGRWARLGADRIGSWRLPRETDTAKGAWREYQVLNEIREDELVSQRKLSDRLGLAVASTNQILKRLVRKGCVTTKRINGKNLAYSVTPKGFSSMFYHVINYTRQTISVFSDVRAMIRKRFAELKHTGHVRAVAIVGTGEVAEAVYLSVQEAELELVAVYASEAANRPWLGHAVRALDDADAPRADVVVATEPEDLRGNEAYAARVRALGTEVIDVYELLSSRLAQFARHWGKERV